MDVRQMSRKTKVISILILLAICGGCMISAAAAERAMPRVVTMGTIMPERSAAVMEYSGAPFMLTENMTASISRAMFPKGMATFTLRQDGGSAYNTTQLETFIADNWYDDVTAGLGAPISITTAVENWMHRLGWIGPVGSAMSETEAYNYAYLAAPAVRGQQYDQFLVVKLYPGQPQVWEQMALIHFGLNSLTGEYQVIFDEGGPDETIAQYLISDA
jgi:hypothetical protein